MVANPTVIIIGAGPAGIAAATKLLENSITNIVILEAEDRIGGRINSVHFVDGTVDLGAQYCHGEIDNIAHELAKDYNILEPGLRGMQSHIYYSNGSKLDELLTRELYDLYLSRNVTDDEFYTTGISLGDLLTRKYNARIEQYKNDVDKFKILKEGLGLVEGHVMIHAGSFSWFHPSAKSDYTVCDGRQNLMWKGFGYRAILDIMMKTYPDPSKKLQIDDKIYLSSPVLKIFWNEAATVKVVTSNDTYFADYVIFTPSIGVLKQQKDTMFEPPLPFPKQEAIEATGFEGVMKVFLHFPEKWWKDEDEAFAFLWSEEDTKELELPWFTHFRSILRVPDNTNVWLGWFTGHLVPEIEKLPVESLKAGCQHVLDKFLGKSYNVGQIGDIIRSTWVTNKNFAGTYSFTKTGFYKKDLPYQTVLAEPLYGVKGEPVILFAGEATNPIHFSTVHGAIETGYREAERIIKLQKRQC